MDSDGDEGDELEPLPALHQAVLDLDLDAVRSVLAAGTSIDTRCGGWTSLIRACASAEDQVDPCARDWNTRVSDRVAMVQTLLDNGAAVDAKSGDTLDTPLHVAVMNQDFPSNDIVELLIATGADVNANDDMDYSVLYAAAQCGRPEAVAVLIAAGADVHKMCQGTFTPLRGAAIAGKVRNYAPLLRAGADIGSVPADHRNAYLDKIAATPGGIRAYEREHRRRLTAVFTNKFPALPVDVISHIVLLWAHCGDYLS